MFTYIVFFILFYFMIKKFYFDGGKTKRKRDMTGKVVIITGSSSGIGKETAQTLCEDGAEVVLACRDKKKTLKVISEMDSKIQKLAHYIPLDLSSFESILQFVIVFKKNFPKVDILLNNAGAFPNAFSLTRDNIESFTQGNCIGHMMLSFLLLDSFDKTEGKIINVSSIAHLLGDLSIKQVESFSDDLYFKHNFFPGWYARAMLYNNTKLMVLYFTSYLAEVLDKHYPHIKAAALHPGVVRTEFMRFLPKHILFKLLFWIGYPIFYLISKSPLDGAQTHLHLCYLGNKEIINGAYYADCETARTSSLARDKKVKEQIINWSCNLIKSKVDIKLLNI